MSSQGVTNAPNTIMPTSPDAQFFVRLNRQCYTPRTTLMTPFGTPSIINKIQNDMVIQLEAFHTGVFLAVMPDGSVSISSNPMDPNSKWLCVRSDCGFTGEMQYVLLHVLMLLVHCAMPNHKFSCDGISQ